MRMKWAQLLSCSFFFFLPFFLFLFFSFFFFAFHRFSLPIKGTCYHFIDDVRFRMCAEDGLKDSFFFFFLRLNFRVLAHDCDQDERKCDQKNGTRDNSATGTEKIFRALTLLCFVFRPSVFKLSCKRNSGSLFLKVIDTNRSVSSVSGVFCQLNVLCYSCWVRSTEWMLHGGQSNLIPHTFISRSI